MIPQQQQSSPPTSEKDHTTTTTTETSSSPFIVGESVGEQGWPIIECLDQCLKSIGDAKEFNVNNDGRGFIYISYRRVTSTTFPSPIRTIDDLIRREIRGLAFDSASGKLVSRCLHKFFNVGEKEETNMKKVQDKLEESVKLSKKMHVLDKLDGSLVIPILETIEVNGEMKKRLRFRTKQGFGHNSTSKGCEKYMYGLREVSNEEYEQLIPTVDQFLQNSSQFQLKNTVRFCLDYIEKGFTPIFEFCSPDYKIVIIYDSPQLSLIAIRDTINGDYVEFDEMTNIANKYSIDCVKSTEFHFQEDKQHSIAEIIAEIKKKTDFEGCVIRFWNGEMYKVKSDWYSTIHFKKQRLEFNYINESHSWWLVLEGGIDDLIPILNTEEEKEYLKTFNDELWNVIDQFSERTLQRVKKIMEENPTQRELANYINKNITSNTLKKLMFDISRHINENNHVKLIVDVVLKFVSQNKVEEAKQFLEAPTLQYRKPQINTNGSTSNLEEE
ncbi:predicted protein [Naegleria gruberi]|uniref:Predicted protein n=1 Tax=Naegleria gruberi TaxID=5762 RepID=D2VKF3_NAEGR|nr:uncharacterized protein NAEGRDRAFT_50279 [Naegleria gruberi]EFC42678.1 predicted protein [Naegleria gruberi]|eukprot:XP_002675422.1 predicted protein [Naegleria gruberi strain NEG-M]